MLNFYEDPNPQGNQSFGDISDGIAQAAAMNAQEGPSGPGGE